MIGEVVKLGFDGSKVNRGLKGVMGGFRKLRGGIGRVTRQVGIGAARHAGASILGAAVRVARAIPDEIKSLSNLNQEFLALKESTGATTENMLALRQAIAKTSNISPDAASKTMKEMVSRIGEGSEYGSAAFTGLQKMGLYFKDLKGLAPDKQLEKIAKGYVRLRESQGIEIANDSTKDIFGARLGLSLTALFTQFDEAMATAKEDTKYMALFMKKLSGELDSFDDIGIALANKLSEAALGFVSGLSAAGVKMKSISEWVKSIKIGESFSGISEVIAANMKQIQSDGLWEWIKAKMSDLGDYLLGKLKEVWEWLSGKVGELGDDLAGKISEGIKSALPSWLSGKKSGGETPSSSSNSGSAAGGVMNILKNVIKTTSDPKTAMIEANTSRTNLLLERMSDTNTTPVYT